ncbi:MAG: glycosyltransferase family 39 protein [Oscillospiraceae bacterium]|nr:glycosyltransferase family 39 protein [Oscillospiraceae bacterium]
MKQRNKRSLAGRRRGKQPSAPWLTGRREAYIAGTLLALGCALRLVALAALPRGLNQDEASSAYEALALLRSGMDRCGNPWPVLLVSWGSGQNALLSYLAIPLAAILGASEWTVRLPVALSGCLTLPVFWRLARMSRGPGFGLAALAILTVNPWHIMMSRWGLESNLLPFFLLTGVWLTALAREKPWLLTGAAAAFGLSLYAYGTAFFFLPLFFCGALVLLRRNLRPVPFLTALAVFLLPALPIGICQARNALGLPAARFLCFTLPRLTEGRQAATSVLGGASPLENLRDLLRILRTQSDGLIWNSLGIGKGGILYVFGLPAAVLGLVYAFRRRAWETEGFLLLALASALVCGVLIRVNINRINMLWLPLIYFSALGLWAALQKLRLWALLPAAGIAVCFALFLSGYGAALGRSGNANFFPGLGEAIRAALAQNAGTVYVSNVVNQPYIFALYYGEIPPETFVESVEYSDPDAAFRQVERFAGFEFSDPDRADVLVLHGSELAGRNVTGIYGSYYLCEVEPSEQETQTQ